jgi:hypothetical protein
MSGPTFDATVELGGKTATGIPVPEEVVAALGDSRRPAVLVLVGGHRYRTTIARMGGRYLIPLSAENRQAAGVAAGDQVRVTVELDKAERTVAVPDDLGSALDPEARAFYDTLAFSHRKEWVRWIEEAKKPETRATRIARTVAALREKKIGR